MTGASVWSEGRSADASTEANRPEPARPAVRSPAPPPEVAAVFGRPDGVAGSFAGDVTPTGRPQPAPADPDPVLAEAFAKPDDETDSLQRDPYAVDEPGDEPPPDPWRDPAAAAALAAPALAPEAATDPVDPGPKLGIREVLFGGRVHWWALATLAMAALMVGLGGGLIGRWTAEVVAPLHTDSVALEPGDSGSSDPRSDVAAVAKAMNRAVVMIDIRTAGGGGTGSGFVIDKSGYIMTNNHVVSLAANDPKAKLEVVFADKHRVPARLVGRDTKTDLAVIKVDDVRNLLVAKMGDSDDLQIGQEVIAFGSPLGLAQTVTSGIVSAVDRPVPLRPDAESDTDAVLNAIQTDASINPGNSGGPLVDDEGRVVGVNTAGRMSMGGGSIGLGFAIPINEAIPVVNTLIKDGKAKHPQIGVAASTVRNDRVLGARLNDVVGGGPAARAGVREGDVVTEFDGRQIEGADELTIAVQRSKIGDEVPFTYWRDGRYFHGKITPDGD